MQTKSVANKRASEILATDNALLFDPNFEIRAFYIGVIEGIVQVQHQDPNNTNNEILEAVWSNARRRDPRVSFLSQVKSAEVPPESVAVRNAGFFRDNTFRFYTFCAFAYTSSSHAK